MATTIGILSDTHMEAPSQELRSLVEGPLKAVDLILHLGDFTSLQVYEYLDSLGCIAVRGNRDPNQLRGLLPETRCLELEGFRLGMIHGFGPPWGMINRIRKAFGRLDALLFGHTHFPLCRYMDGTLYLNPGPFRRDILSGFKRRYARLTVDRGLFPQLFVLD